MKDWVDIRKDEKHVARERAKAREIKRSEWWKEQLRQGVCYYCGKDVGEACLTMDHKIPVARGGRSVRSNVVPCCDACNKDKRCLTPVERLLETLDR